MKGPVELSWQPLFKLYSSGFVCLKHICQSFLATFQSLLSPSAVGGLSTPPPQAMVTSHSQRACLPGSSHLLGDSPQALQPTLFSLTAPTLRVSADPPGSKYHHRYRCTRDLLGVIPIRIKGRGSPGLRLLRRPCPGHRKQSLRTGGVPCKAEMASNAPTVLGHWLGVAPGRVWLRCKLCFGPDALRLEPVSQLRS